MSEPKHGVHIKTHNTAKLLIAFAPNGFIMYVSPLYGGRASDYHISKSCAFLIIYYLVVKLWRTDVLLCIQQVKLNNSFFHEWQVTINSTDKRQ